MGKRSSLRTNLTNTDHESVSVVVAPSRRGVFHLIPDPDNTLTIGSGVLTLQLSADGENFFDHTTTLSNSSPGTQTAVALDAVYAVRFRTSTADGAADPNALIKAYFS